jgi:hypothetical protein
LTTYSRQKHPPDRYSQTTEENLKNTLDAILSTLSQAYEALKVPATRSSYGAKIFRLESTAGTPEKPAAVPAPDLHLNRIWRN